MAFFFKGKQPKVSAGEQTLQAIQKLTEQEENLEKRKVLVEKKIHIEIENAREFTKQQKKSQALIALKKKKLLETEIANIDNLIMRTMEQKSMLEGQMQTVQMVSAMKAAADANKAALKETGIDDVDKVIDEIGESNQEMQQIQDALQTPTGYSAAIDEDELLAELNDLEGQITEEQMLEPAAVPATPSQQLPNAPATPAKPAKTPEELELEELEQQLAA